MRHRRVNSKKLPYLWKTTKAELTWSLTMLDLEMTHRSSAKVINSLPITMRPSSSAGMTKTAHTFFKSSTKESTTWWTASTAWFTGTLTPKTWMLKFSNSTREWWHALRWGSSIKACWHSTRSTRRCRPTTMNSTPPYLNSSNGS